MKKLPNEGSLSFVEICQLENILIKPSFLLNNKLQSGFYFPKTVYSSDDMPFAFYKKNKKNF